MEWDPNLTPKQNLVRHTRAINWCVDHTPADIREAIASYAVEEYENSQRLINEMCETGPKDGGVLKLFLIKISNLFNTVVECYRRVSLEGIKKIVKL